MFVYDHDFKLLSAIVVASAMLRTVKSPQRHNNRNLDCIGHILLQYKDLQCNSNLNLKPCYDITIVVYRSQYMLRIKIVS